MGMENNPNNLETDNHRHKIVGRGGSRLAIHSHGIAKANPSVPCGLKLQSNASTLINKVGARSIPVCSVARNKAIAKFLMDVWPNVNPNISGAWRE